SRVSGDRRDIPSCIEARSTWSIFCPRSRSRRRLPTICSTGSSRRWRKRPTPARSATARSSYSTWNRSCASAPGKPVRRPSKGNTMKRLLALLALAGACGLFGSVQAQDKAADQKAAAPAVTTAPAPAPAAPEAKATEAPKAEAAAAAAPPAPDTPQLIAVDKISSGDTAWMLTSTALVLMMTIPGLALFYGGMVRKKNVLATLMQSFAITCV